MGNCLKSQSSSKYAGDYDDDEEWNSPGMEGGEINGGENFNNGKTREVKIKITKKQLEELLGKMDVKELKVNQVLAQLLNHSDGCQVHQRPWRPALQSIPE
ncbi:hypothetical protein L6164_031127 [Bauhinia variegata]|uniref:Uncharacterized protein n=1 Tax=Bauhinia variegata TaxID=167791 RepID=A0ACB9LFT8_BAUVA|nr:hypothetical protein L6164_031127 [Bauhinia variegata]